MCVRFFRSEFIFSVANLTIDDITVSKPTDDHAQAR